MTALADDTGSDAAHDPPQGNPQEVTPGRADPRHTLGELGEELATRYFRDRGATVLDRNWHCRQGEIDLVVQEPDGVLVGVEVKARRGLGFGEPVEAVTPRKLRRLRRLLASWRSAHPGVEVSDLRLDVVGVLIRPDEPVRLRHVTGVG